MSKTRKYIFTHNQHRLFITNLFITNGSETLPVFLLKIEIQKLNLRLSISVYTVTKDKAVNHEIY